MVRSAAAHRFTASPRSDPITPVCRSTAESGFNAAHNAIWTLVSEKRFLTAEGFNNTEPIATRGSFRLGGPRAEFQFSRHYTYSLHRPFGGGCLFPHFSDGLALEDLHSTSRRLQQFKARLNGVHRLRLRSTIASRSVPRGDHPSSYFRGDTYVWREGGLDIPESPSR